MLCLLTYAGVTCRDEILLFHGSREETVCISCDCEGLHTICDQDSLPLSNFDLHM
jgi:hypothetical protein